MLFKSMRSTRNRDETESQLSTIMESTTRSRPQLRMKSTVGHEFKENIKMNALKNVKIDQRIDIVVPRKLLKAKKANGNGLCSTARGLLPAISEDGEHSFFDESISISPEMHIHPKGCYKRESNKVPMFGRTREAGLQPNLVTVLAGADHFTGHLVEPKKKTLKARNTKSSRCGGVSKRNGTATVRPLTQKTRQTCTLSRRPSGSFFEDVANITENEYNYTECSVSHAEESMDSYKESPPVSEQVTVFNDNNYCYSQQPLSRNVPTYARSFNESPRKLRFRPNTTLLESDGTMSTYPDSTPSCYMQQHHSLRVRARHGGYTLQAPTVYPQEDLFVDWDQQTYSAFSFVSLDIADLGPDFVLPDGYEGGEEDDYEGEGDEYEENGEDDFDDGAIDLGEPDDAEDAGEENERGEDFDGGEDGDASAQEQSQSAKSNSSSSSSSSSSKSSKSSKSSSSKGSDGVYVEEQNISTMAGSTNMAGSKMSKSGSYSATATRSGTNPKYTVVTGSFSGGSGGSNGGYDVSYDGSDAGSRSRSKTVNFKSEDGSSEPQHFRGSLTLQTSGVPQKSMTKSKASRSMASGTRRSSGGSQRSGGSGGYGYGSGSMRSGGSGYGPGSYGPGSYGPRSLKSKTTGSGFVAASLKSDGYDYAAKRSNNGSADYDYSYGSYVSNK